MSESLYRLLLAGLLFEAAGLTCEVAGLRHGENLTTGASAVKIKTDSDVKRFPPRHKIFNRERKLSLRFFLRASLQTSPWTP